MSLLKDRKVWDNVVNIVAKQNQRLELCVRAALLRVLVSPYFLFRAELDPLDVEPGVMYAVNEYDLASRLSYFLWNSMPDDDLVTLAANGKLRLDISSPDYPEETPLNNLWLAMLERFGAPSQKLGDSTGVLGGLS